MSTTISRKTLSDEIAEKLGIGKAKSKEVVDAVLDGIVDHMRAGNTVNFRGFGVFKVVTKAPRVGRNPMTGESVQIAGGKRIKFKAGNVVL